MRTMRLLGGIVLAGGLLLLGGILPASAAIKIEQLQNTPVMKDYAVGPGKVELLLEPGQSVTGDITVVNRYGKEKVFKLELEDFKGSTDPKQLVEFTGLLKGPYSLKDFIKPEIMQFTLQHGDRITIPVTISIPTNTPPGGLYGSVIVTTQDNPNEQATDPTAAQGAINIKSRIAILYFVRVKGDVNENVTLTNFSVSPTLCQKGPVDFSYAVKNDGSVYEDPYGYIQVRNLYGTTVDQVPIQPYYVLPAAERVNNVSWDHGFMFGRYKATLFLNRGYGNNVDQMSVVFWVLPWKVIVPVLIGLILIIWLCVWLKNNVKLQVGKKGPPATPPAQK